MKASRTTLVAAAVVLLIGGFWLRHHFSPGEVVKRKVLAMAGAFEEERLLGVMAMVSRSYSDPWGNSYETFAGHLQQLIEIYDGLDVDLLIGETVASDEQVRVGLEFIVSGQYEGAREYVVGSRAEPCSAVLVWRKETPGWRLVSTAELDIPELREELEARRPR